MKSETITNILRKRHEPHYITEPRIFPDHRGQLNEVYHADRLLEVFSLGWEKGGGRHGDPVPCFRHAIVSESHAGVIRGMHYQWPCPQGKFICVVVGAIYDVIVDIRKGSPDYGKWTSYSLSRNGSRLWVPQGFAHGFYAEEDSVVLYMCDTPHIPENDKALNWACVKVGIDWEFDEGFEPIVSGKDANAPTLDELERLDEETSVLPDEPLWFS